MVPFWKEIFKSKEGMEELMCKDILSDKSIKNLDKYVKLVPNIKQEMMKHIFSSNASKTYINCKNLQQVNKQMMQLMISDVDITDPSNAYSYVLRLIDRADMETLNIFLKQHDIKLTYDYLNGMNAAIKKEFNILEHIFSIENQKFVIEFIKTFNIFQIYPVEEYSPHLL